jgi:parallel beta-helix repeat protein
MCVGICVLALLAFAWASAASRAGKAGCTKVAAPGGNDSSAGTADTPYATAHKLVDALAPGDTGCLRAGTYRLREITVETPGIRLTSYAGERATLVGWIRVKADSVTVDHLTLNGRNPQKLPSPIIDADNVTFRDNDVSSTGARSCFLFGGTTEVRHPVIKGNRIHGCGQGPLSQGIYMQDVNDAKIVGNTIYDNPETGIKVGMHSQGALIRGNVIDGNKIGVIFAGDETRASSGNVVAHNVIANSTRWGNVQFYWPGPVGSGNLVRRNCVHASPDSTYHEHGGIIDDRAVEELAQQGVTHSGFTASGNLIAEPGYVDRRTKDFRLRERSQCRAVYPRGGGPAYSSPLARALIELRSLVQAAVRYADSPRLPGTLEE